MLDAEIGILVRTSVGSFQNILSSPFLYANSLLKKLIRPLIIPENGITAKINRQDLSFFKNGFIDY